MLYVKLVVNILLAAAALSSAHHQPKPTRHRPTSSASLTTKGRSKRLARSHAHRQPAAEAVGRTYTVTATAYQAVASQTDARPFVTADNSHIKPGYSSKTRWLALSPDLLAHRGGKFRYGDQVWVRGISPRFDGLYTVHDTMNKRHHHCLDILTHPREKAAIFSKDVKIRLARAGATVPRLASQHRVRAGTRALAQARPAREKGQSPRRQLPHLPKHNRPSSYFATTMR